MVKRLLVRLAGLEPAARGLGNRCSIHLSYRRISGKAPDMGFVKPSLVVSKGFYHKKRSGQYFPVLEACKIVRAC